MMLKKFLIAIMCVAILLSFVACSKDASHPSKPTEEKTSVFKTEDIIRITFYAYYGGGKGSDVPAEHLDEIVAWLNSFKIDSNRKVPEVVPPGTNTIHVEIAYSDGSIVIGASLK